MDCEQTDAFFTFGINIGHGFRIDIKVNKFDVQFGACISNGFFDLVSVVHVWIRAIDPSDIDNVEFVSPFVNSYKAVVTTKGFSKRVFDVVECGARRNRVCNTDESMFFAVERFVFEFRFEVIIRTL